MEERADVHELASYPYLHRITNPSVIGIVILPVKEYYRSVRKDGSLWAKVACRGTQVDNDKQCS